MLLTLLRALARLPLPVLHTLGRALGRLVYLIPGRYRRRLRTNAARAGYTRRAFAWRAAGQTGAMIAETPRIWFDDTACLAQVQIAREDQHVIAAARASRRGIVYLTPHLGSFEVTARYLARTAPLTVMFRPPRSSLLAAVMTTARNASGVTAVPASLQGVRAFVRALQRGEAVGMLPDQVPRTGDGVWVPFFDRMAYTVTLPCRLAQQTHAIVILTAAERLPQGRGWRIHALRLPELPATAAEQARLVNQAMETLIRRFPEQYLWGYHRYKTPRGAPPAPRISA